MSLSDLASVGSFVSGFAVLVSLVFLYFQLRQLSGQVKQAEKNQRGVLSQGYFTRVTENLRWSGEPANAELRARLIAGETAFTAGELYRLRMMFRTLVVNVMDAYVHHKSGLLDTMSFDGSMLNFRAVLSQPVFRAIWMDSASTIAPDFRDVVETMLAEEPLAKPLDDVARFKANLAKV